MVGASGAASRVSDNERGRGSVRAGSEYTPAPVVHRPAGGRIRLLMHVRRFPPTHPDNRTFEVTHLPFTIGRSKNADLTIHSEALGRKQCRVSADVHGFFVESFGGRLPTVVDGLTLGKRERSQNLYNGSRIVMGDAEIVCELV